MRCNSRGRLCAQFNLRSVHLALSLSCVSSNSFISDRPLVGHFPALSYGSFRHGAGLTLPLSLSRSLSLSLKAPLQCGRACVCMCVCVLSHSVLHVQPSSPNTAQEDGVSAVLRNLAPRHWDMSHFVTPPPPAWSK